MKLLKVSVPNFRNLQNVELTFEPELSPAVFPIASQNGGGKSTLLQLIFTLFHCAVDGQRHIYINNLIDSVYKNIKTGTFASFIFSYNKNQYNFDFSIIDTENVIDYNYSKIVQIESELEGAADTINYNISNAEKVKSQMLRNLQQIEVNIAERTKPGFPIDLTDEQYLDVSNQVTEINKQISYLKSEYENKVIKGEKRRELEKIKYKNRIIFWLKTRKVASEKQKNAYALVCKSDSDNFDFTKGLFDHIGNNIYLASPSSQSFLFLNKSVRKMMLSNMAKYQESVFSILRKNQQINNLHFYSNLEIRSILNAFQKAREEDWEKALESKDQIYGELFHKVVESFHDFIGQDKYIFPSKQLNSIIIKKQVSETEKIELEPEDLSHGELRRLGIYAWIKYNIPENSIVLIDEVENAMHPDWQYNIANELASWGNNQYLLATHSFHLCEALTPKHVKEIEPKMCKPASEVVDND